MLAALPMVIAHPADIVIRIPTLVQPKNLVGIRAQRIVNAWEAGVLAAPPVQIARRSQWHTFSVMPKRWVVERSFAWLGKYRWLWKNCKHKLNTSLQFVHVAFLA